MKNRWKRIKAVLLSLMYVAIYFVIAVAVEIAYVLWQKSTGEASLTETVKNTVNNSYALGGIAIVVSFWIYLIIGHFRKEPLNKVIHNEKMPPVMSAMAVCLAVGARFLVTVYSVYSQNVEVLKESVDKASAITPELTGTAQLIIALLSIVVLVPLFEEFLFRGLVMNELSKVMRPWAAIVLQGIVFGVAHGVLFQSIFTVVLGIVLGVVYHRTKSLKIVTICHGVFNFSVVLTQNNLTLQSGIIMSVLGLLLMVFSMIYIVKFSKKQ